MYAIGERFNSMIAFRVFCDPLFKLVAGVSVRVRLGVEQSTVLRLAARTLEINHKNPCYLDRDLASHVLLNQSQTLDQCRNLNPPNSTPCDRERR